MAILVHCVVKSRLTEKLKVLQMDNAAILFKARGVKVVITGSSIIAQLNRSGIKS
jgi:hypothetical protein